MPTSPNGARGLTITDAQGKVWTFAGNANGKGWQAFRDGVYMGVRGEEFLWWNGTVYLKDGQARWLQYTGVATKWVSIPADPSGGVPPPSPDPQPCILGDRIEVKPDFSACQIDGTQSRTVTWTRPILQPPTNGGLACGPTSGSYLETRDCEYIPPPPGTWPPFPATPPPPQPSPDQIARMKAGLGYPERRVYRQSQWWDSAENDIDNARHTHLEAATPREVPPDIVQFDLFTRFFHGQGFTFVGIRKIVMRTNQPNQEWMPVYVQGRPPGVREVLITEHEQVFWTPVAIDIRGTTPGTYTFEFDCSAIRPDGHQLQCRLIFQMYVGVGVSTATNGGMVPEGWLSNNLSGSQFGYLSCQVWGMREFASDASEQITFKPRATPGRSVRLVVCKNPNIHAHPPIYGEVLFDTTFVQPASPPKFLVTQPPMVVGDRLFWRISDSDQTEIGAAAQVGVITLGEG